MKALQLFTCLALILISTSFTVGKQHNAFKKETTYVWICVTEGAYAYHYNYDCRGLKPCKGEKRKVTLEDAKVKYKRKICGWED